MGKYLVQASYIQQGISGLVKSPEDRTAVLDQMTASMGERSSASTIVSVITMW